MNVDRISYMNSDIDSNNPKWHKKNHKIKRLRKKQEQKLSTREYVSYLKELRLYDDKIAAINRKKNIEFFCVLSKIMRFYRIISGIKIFKLNTKVPTVSGDRPIIFVITHVGKEDITVFNDIANTHYTILSGDYESLHCRIEGWLMRLNGVLFFDMRSKQERIEIEGRVASVLKSGDSILCSMEAAWNISPNEIVQKLFPGMIRVAIETNAVIVPIGIERFSKKQYGINISKTLFDPSKYIEIASDKKQLLKATGELRQILAETKYELYFDRKIRNNITISRSSIGDYESYYEQWKKDILSEWTFTEKLIEEKKYRDFEKPKYAYTYLVDKYKSLNKSELDITKYCELLLDLKSPVYPNEIHNELKEIWREIIECNNLL